MFLNIQIDLIILKTDDKQFTLTTKKNHRVSPLTQLVNHKLTIVTIPVPVSDPSLSDYLF